MRSTYNPHQEISLVLTHRELSLLMAMAGSSTDNKDLPIHKKYTGEIVTEQESQRVYNSLKEILMSTGIWSF